MKNFDATKSEKQVHRNDLRKVKLSVYIVSGNQVNCVDSQRRSRKIRSNCAGVHSRNVQYIINCLIGVDNIDIYHLIKVNGLQTPVNSRKTDFIQTQQFQNISEHILTSGVSEHAISLLFLVHSSCIATVFFQV